jgi:spermidine dehydrogenase
MSDYSDHELGMDRAISRRDFFNGIAVAIGAFGSVPSKAEPSNVYPPALIGMRGSQPGSFEIAHSLRDGTFWKNAGAIEDTGESYDLVVVGAGISGLSAAHFFLAKAQGARVLILENHDDFGGHARRNEFHLGGGLQLLNGGTLLIDSPTPYSPQADGLLRELGIDPVSLEKQTSNHEFYPSLGLERGVFFDKETFGTDRLVVRARGMSWEDFLKKTPLSAQVQRDILRIEEGKVDYLAGLTSAQKKDRLSRISYRDYLLKLAKVDPGVIPYYQTRSHDEYGVGIDAEPALDCWALEYPGFQGLSLEPGTVPRMSYTAAGYARGGSYRYHFPDGNASIARLLVRKLIPEALPGDSVEDIVTSQADYSRLDRTHSPVRIRLNSTVVRVRNLGEISAAREVEVVYASGNQVRRVRARNCVLACWNMTIPYLCPELSDRQKEALRYLVKVPLVYTSVGIRNWESFQKLGVSAITAPGSYHSSVALNWPVNIGQYKSPRSPTDPILLHLVRTPCKPGLPVREQQKAGRAELQDTSFETFERKIRDQLGRTLSGGGFDPRKDIEAITVNRWPHGYGYEYNPLFDPEWAPDEAPNIIGRKPFGRITIANSDSGATAYTDVAINEAWRAVNELPVDSA